MDVLKIIAFVLVAQVVTAQAVDSTKVSALWLSEVISIINKLTPDPASIDKNMSLQKSVSIKIKNVRSKTRLVKRLNRMYRRKKLESYQYDLLMSELLNVKVDAAALMLTKPLRAWPE